MKRLLTVFLHMCSIAIATGQSLVSTPFVNGQVNCIEKVGNNLFISGAFTQIGSTPIFSLAKMDAITGTLDASWQPAPNGIINTMVQANGKIIVGGEFTFIGGKVRNHIAIFDATTGAMDTITPSAQDTVNTLYVHNGLLYYNEWYFQPGWSSPSGTCIKRFNLNTGINSNWQSDMLDADAINTISVLGNYVYVGGQFDGGHNLNYRFHDLARFDLITGSIDTTWDPFLFANHYTVASGVGVNKIISDNNYLYLVGVFDTIKGSPRILLQSWI